MDSGRAISFVTLDTHDLPTLRTFYRSWSWTERDGGDDGFAQFDVGMPDQLTHGLATTRRAATALVGLAAAVAAGVLPPSAGAGAATTAAPSADHAEIAASYRYVDLGVIGVSPNGDERSDAAAINSSRQVVGSSTFPEGDAFHGFLWQDGQMLDLDTMHGDPDRGESSAAGVNDAGTVVGAAQVDSTSPMHAFLPPAESSSTSAQGSAPAAAARPATSTTATRSSARTRPARTGRTARCNARRVVLLEIRSNGWLADASGGARWTGAGRRSHQLLSRRWIPDCTANVDLASSVGSSRAAARAVDLACVYVRHPRLATASPVSGCDAYRPR